MREPIVDEDVASDARIFGSMATYPGRMILGGRRAVDEALDARSSLISCIVSLRTWVLPRHTRTWTSTSIQVGNSGQLNKLGPSGIDGLEWTIFSLMLGPGRVDPMGLATEKADTFPNTLYIIS